MRNVIPFLGRRRRPRTADTAPTAPLASPTAPEAPRSALAACMAPPQPGDRYHVAPLWRGDYVAGFSLWDSGRDGITPRRLRSWMVADFGRHLAAGRADNLRVALNAEWDAAQARLARSQGRPRPSPLPAPEAAT